MTSEFDGDLDGCSDGSTDISGLKEDVLALETSLATIKASIASSADISNLENDLPAQKTAMVSHGASIVELTKVVEDIRRTVLKHGDRLDDQDYKLTSMANPIDKATIDAITYKVRKDFDWLFFNQ